MAITHLGVKSLQGTKADRVSDSLGSSADGINTGITQPISLNSSTNKVDFDAKRDGNNYAMSYDLGATLSETQWVARFPVTISTLTGNSGQNTVFMFFGLSSIDAKTGATSSSFDYIGTQLKKSAGASQWKAQAVDGGALNVEGTNFAHTLTTQTYYVEIKRTGATSATVELFSDSGYSSSIESESLTPASTIQNLRYIWIGNQDSTGGTTNKIVGTVGEIKVWNSTTTASGTATYTASPNSSTNWTSGGAKLGIGAYKLDNTSEGRIEVGSASDWQFLHNTTAKWTIATWFKRPTSFTGLSGVNSGLTGANISWVCETTDGVASGISIKYDNRNDPDHQLQVEIINESNQVICVLQTNNWYPDDDDWHHIAVTYNQSLANTNLVVYLDGVQKGTADKTSNTPSNVDSGDTLRIGCGVDTHANAGNWTLDDFGIWNRALTATEISDLVNAPNSWWVGGTSKNVTIDGNTVTTGSGSGWANWVQGKAVTSPTTLEFSVDDTNTNCIVGFGTGTGADSPSAGSPMKHCAYLTSGGDIFWSDSTGETDTGSNRASGDTYKLVWQSNGNLDLYLKPSGGSYGSSLKSWTSVTGTLYPMVQGYSGIVVTMLPTETADGALVSSLTDKSELKAYYSMNSTKTETLDGTVDISEDFSSDGWTHEDTSISGGAFNFDCDQGGVNTSHHSYKALGQTVSDSKWTMRCKLTFNNVSASGNPDGTGLWLMLCDTPNSDSGVDSLGFSVILGHQSGFVPYFRLTGGDNTHPRTNLHGGSSGLSHTVSATTYYVELKRTSSTSATLSIYSDSDFSTLIESATLTISSSITGLDNIQTIMFDGNNSGSQALDGTIDDIKIYDGSANVDGCKNDFSSTSDLEAMTNLPANTIFLQTDDTPTYWWKQSDNTWLEDESIPYVWSTNSAKITKRTSSATSGGTQSSFMIAGMREPDSGNTTYADVQKWDGTSWSSGTSKPQNTIHASGGGDSNTDHMTAGGYHCCDNAGHNETHEWNGSSWSTSGTLPSAGWGFVGDGNTTTGIMGGNMGYGFGNRSASYNGSSWTSISGGVGVVGTGTMAGKETDAIHGYQGSCEKWNGSAWSNVSSLTAGSSGANGGSGGDSSQALFFGGGTLVTDIWNGTAFKAGSNYVSTSAGDRRSCNVDSKGVGLSTWDGGTSAGNGDVFKYSR